MTVKLKPFTARFTWTDDGTLYGHTIEIWVFNLKAARESAESFAREEGYTNAKITVTPSKHS